MTAANSERAGTHRRLPKTVIALGLTSFFTDVGSEMVFPLLPVLLASIGAAPAYLGLVEGLADATASITKLASGYVADRLPAKRPLVLVGYGLAALVRPLMALASAPWHVLAVRLADRVGKGVRAAPRDVLIASSVPQEQAGRAFGFHRALDHAGAVAGPLLAAGLMAAGWELRSVFMAALVPGLLSVACVLLVREPRAQLPTSDPSTKAATPTLPPTLRRYLGVLTLFSITNSSDAFLLLRAREIGVAEGALPLVWAVFHVVKLVSAHLGGAWSDRLSRTTLIICGWWVYAVTYLAFAVATEPWHAWSLFIVYGAYYGLTEPAEKALVKDLAPPAALGRAYGLYNFIVGACAIPAGLLTGWLWQEHGAHWALSLGALGGALSALTLAVGVRPRRRDDSL